MSMQRFIAHHGPEGSQWAQKKKTQWDIFSPDLGGYQVFTFLDKREFVRLTFGFLFYRHLDAALCQCSMIWISALHPQADNCTLPPMGKEIIGNTCPKSTPKTTGISGETFPLIIALTVSSVILQEVTRRIKQRQEVSFRKWLRFSNSWRNAAWRSRWCILQTVLELWSFRKVTRICLTRWW